MENAHGSLAFVLAMAQCFGMFPVSGVNRDEHRTLRFKWKAFKVYYSVAVVVLLAVNCSFQVHAIWVGHSNFTMFVTLLFFLCGLITAILFFKLAMDWPKVIKRWTEVDASMASYGFPKGLNARLKVVAAVIMVAALIEHSLFLTFAIFNSDKTLSGLEIVHVFLENNFGHIFRYVSYNLALGLLLKLLNIQMTFSWNYMDLFVILVSLSLSARFKQVGERMRRFARCNVKDEGSWMAVREDYYRLSKLCSTVDDAIGNITLLSFANNIFVILVQLFNSLEPNYDEAVIGRVYFIYSFGFLLVRTTAVSMVAADVDSESKKPIECLNSLPYYIYNDEVDRLIYHVKIDPPALTGRRFFKITKSMILGVAGVIVTYELILIQFNTY